MKLAKTGGRLALIALTGYVLIVALFSIFQDALLFHPWVAPENTLLAAAPQYGLIPWRDATGQIIGWKRPGPAGGTPFLILHGNAGSAIHRAVIATRFAQEPGVGPIYILEYPGYGARPGKPSITTVVAATSDALGLIHRETGHPPVLVGESLGSAVAGQVAGNLPDQVRGLVLITPIHRLSEVARHHFWFLPTEWILGTAFDNSRALAHFTSPVALVAAGRDDIVPPEQASHLSSLLPGPNKLWVEEHATHNSLDYQPGSRLWSEVLLFVLSHP